MKKYYSFIIMLVILTGSVFAQENPSKILNYKTIGDVSLNLHIFYPPNHKPTDKRPAIVFFFGGGWIIGTPKQFYPQSAYLASRGMVAISTEYRVKERHKTSPIESVKDAKSTMRWVREHADELGIDPDMLAAGGGSAGGHLAAATGTVNGFEEASETGGGTYISSRPNALVLFNPVFDNGPGGYGHDRVKPYWRSFSPLHNIDRDTPPTIIFLGTKDEFIPVATAENYKERMDEVGIRCDLHLYKDQPHGFFNKAKYSETLREADKFLTSLGYLDGLPTLQKK